MNNLFSQKLNKELNKLRSAEEKAKEAVLKELKEVLCKSSYNYISIFNTTFIGYDKDGYDSEDKLDNPISYLINAFDGISTEKLDVILYRGKDF